MSQPPDSPSRLAGHLASLWKVAAAYLLLALLMTFPLALDLTGSLPAGAGDIWQNYWNFWWWKTALLDLGRHPYFSPYIFHPTGAKLIFHTHSPFNMLVALPITATVGPTAAYNFCVILALWLAGVGMYLLVKEITDDARGAFLAGLVFAFFPQLMEQILEHLNLVAVQFMPLTLFFLLRLVRLGGLRNLLGVSGCFALTALCSWHLGLKLILALVPLAGVELIRRRYRAGKALRDLMLASMVAAVLLLPLATPLIVEMIGADYYRKPAQNLGVEARFLMIPHYGHTLWGGLVSTLYVDQPYRSPGYICYLGIVPLVLAVVAAVRRRRGALFWWGFTAFAILLALGRHPLWGREVIESITLPFYLLEHVPVFDLLRVANRFMILASLGLAVLVGLGWTALRKKSDARFLLLMGLICFEYSWIPYPVKKVEVSPFYEELAQSGRSGAVFNIPSHQRSRSGPNLVAQTRHGRPIGDGYVSTRPVEADDFIAREPALSDLIGIPKLERPVDRDRLLKLGFDTLVIHKFKVNSVRKKALAEADPADIVGRRSIRRLGGIPDETYERLRAELESLCGEPAFEDDKIVVYFLERRTDQDMSTVSPSPLGAAGVSPR